MLSDLAGILSSGEMIHLSFHGLGMGVESTHSVILVSGRHITWALSKNTALFLNLGTCS